MTGRLPSSDNNVDLLVTVDPVGVWDYRDGANHWIELYAQAGWPAGGYFHWKSRTIVKFGVPYYRCKRHRWHFHCKWSKKKIRVKVYYPAWQSTMRWDWSDWVAYAGGKGWYSSYDPGDARPDQLIKIAAHHDDFDYMLWAMEHGNASVPNNNFSITRNAGVTNGSTKWNSHEAKQRKYASDKNSFGTGIWH
jgi:hypothetical protein